MPIRARQFAALTALALLASGLAGCGTINEKLANGAGDYVPMWMGGEPSDVPPRPGTAKYDEYQKEQERRRMEVKTPTDANNPATTTSTSGLNAVH